MANWTRLIQLAIGRVGSGRSNSPLGELDVGCPTHPMASWTWLIQLARCGGGYGTDDDGDYSGGDYGSGYRGTDGHRYGNNSGRLYQ
ncbi:hypothetical protein DY000_02049011 [Brassica cretica]|uniref:Uncharacterized protein n=1 Tax=Brassica cretica TaxID=69181 RepID=A0ABQ7EZ81_BRACR|nr:hypothetical protein DY000_02049011 [Brassica cretica]